MTGNVGTITMTNSTELEKIPGIKSEVLERLQVLNIVSVEMLLSYATAMADDPAGFSTALGISEKEMQDLVESAKSLVPQDLLNKLTTKPPLEDMPYGARDPKEIDD